MGVALITQTPYFLTPYMNNIQKLVKSPDRPLGKVVQPSESRLSMTKVKY